MRAASKVLLFLLFLAAIVAAGLWLARPMVEQRIASFVVSSASAAGVTMGDVRFSWRGPLRLRRVVVDRPDTGRVEIDSADIRWDYEGGRDPRAHVRGFDLVSVRLRRGPLTVEMNEASFDVVSWQVKDGVERLKLRQRPQGGEFETTWRSGAPGAGIGVSMRALDLSALRVGWAGDEVAQPGVWTGRVDVSATASGRAVKGDTSADLVRVALPGAFGGAREYGAPVSLRLAWDAVREGEALDLRAVTARLAGLEVDGHGRLSGAGDAATIDASASARVEIGATFRAAGLRMPLAVAGREGLGTADLDLSVSGPLARPAELRLVPRLRFEPAPRSVERLQFLSRPFRYEPDGGGAAIEVGAGAPDFIPIGAVPPLFLRALLLSEDAGFYGHPGVDVAEIPVAWADNAERGELARGASTITQQLVKNLFLSGEKTLARKLEEAALALLVDAALSKPRILEIYVNVIEWGPGVRGLVPAARHYFGKAPADLTAKEIAFLVCLIPSPVRYHQAHTAGRAGPGMEHLMANLLAKLRSVNELDEDAYRSALAEGLHFAPEAAGPPAVS